MRNAESMKLMEISSLNSRALLFQKTIICSGKHCKIPMNKFIGKDFHFAWLFHTGLGRVHSYALPHFTIWSLLIYVITAPPYSLWFVHWSVPALCGERVPVWILWCAEGSLIFICQQWNPLILIHKCVYSTKKEKTKVKTTFWKQRTPS